ncbi:hypothetical protein AALP_AA6G171100 [Arabis alpina]|uniref:PPM-type phosphatase domain-containing protein n=1 Tax=Arabis alpina TaxID=50452 RepID=A0A087GPT1_ARAAL|nr:hypothetical protein AALP_AA6G171100 [Arabis alpina]
METDITLPILAGDCDSGESKRVRVADPGFTVDNEGRPVKLPKIEDNGDVGTSEATEIPVYSLMADVAINDIEGQKNADHGVVSVMGRQRAMTTAVSTVVDEIPSYDIFGIFDGLRLAKFFEERLRRLVKEEVTASNGRGVGADWNKVMRSSISEAVETLGSITAGAVVTIVGKEEVVVLCRGGARVVLYSLGGIALPLCHIHHQKSGVEQILKIHKRKKIDDFIVLACDGLWDVVSDNDTYQLVKRCLHGKLPDECRSESRTEKAAVILAELAIARGSKENINVVVIDLKNSYHFLTVVRDGEEEKIKDGEDIAEEDVEEEENAAEEEDGDEASDGEEEVDGEDGDDVEEKEDGEDVEDEEDGEEASDDNEASNGDEEEEDVQSIDAMVCEDESEPMQPLDMWFRNYPISRLVARSFHKERQKWLRNRVSRSETIDSGRP